MAARVSMEQAFMEDQPDPESPPPHTEHEYAAMVPDSPASQDLDFSDDPTSFRLDGPVPFAGLLTGGRSITPKPEADSDKTLKALVPVGDFVYSSVAKNQIRLLRLAPGARGDPIYCALKPVYLASITPEEIAFQALSYAWVPIDLPKPSSCRTRHQI